MTDRPQAPTGFRERFALGLNNHFFYGWIMLGVAAVVLLASASLSLQRYRLSRRTGQGA